MRDLTEEDYDALYSVVKAALPRIVVRSTFSDVLAQLVEDGVVSITVTDFEIMLSMPRIPKTGVFRVKRNPRLH